MNGMNGTTRRYGCPAVEDKGGEGGCRTRVKYPNQQFQGKLQSAPTPPAGSRHSCQPTVKLHVLPLVWPFPLEKEGSRRVAAGIFLGKPTPESGYALDRSLGPSLLSTKDNFVLQEFRYLLLFVLRSFNIRMCESTSLAPVPGWIKPTSCRHRHGIHI